MTRLYNPPAMVRWNMDTHYLVDLARLGIPVVASQILEHGSSPMPRDVLVENAWDEAVINPCVSGTAQHTYRANCHSSGAYQARLDTLLAEEAMLVQPLQDKILSIG